MNQIALPFLTLGEEAVRVTDWSVRDPVSVLDVRSGWIADWDYARDLTLERNIQVDLAAAADQLQLLADDLELQLVLRIATGPGSMPRVVRSVQSHALRRNNPEVQLQQVVRGAELSMRLRAECHLLLASDPNDPPPLAPKLPSSRLWQDRLDIRLEGEEPRFPMEFLNFAERFSGRPEAAAPWLLHWVPGHHDRDFGGAVRLFVNSERPDFTERLLQGDRATIQVILADVMQQIIGDYIDHQGTELLAPEAEEGSIGAQAQFWMDLAFPGLHLSQVRAMREQSPGIYHAGMLAAADVAAGEYS